MVAGGRTKARCSLFCSAASEHSSRSLRGADRAPLSAQGEERKVAFKILGVFFSGTRPRRSSSRPASPTSRTSRAPRATALPGWARVYCRDKRALLEGGKEKRG